MRFVNSYQSKELRRYKYNFLRLKGADYCLARRCRDWTMGHIKRIILPKLENERLYSN